MSPKTHGIESCTYHFHSWKPFSKTLDYDSPKTLASCCCCCGVHNKRQCRSDRTTTATGSVLIEAAMLDLSKLSLIGGGKRRRRRGSRSVSGRSSDRSGNRSSSRRRRRCCSVGAVSAATTTYGGCSDFQIAVCGTDSSGELFVNGGGGGGDMQQHWNLDVSEVVNTTRSLRGKENFEVQNGNFEGLGNESGYGSEPGYRGDAEFGYGDEIDEEESFWGDEFGALSRMEKVGENTLQKVHHRCRRRKQDCRMVIP